jgi:hypothetical protein
MIAWEDRVFGDDFEAAFSLPLVPLDNAGQCELARPVVQAAPAIPRAPGSPSPLDELTMVLETLPEVDPDYSASISSAFSAIGSMVATSNSPGLLA